MIGRVGQGWPQTSEVSLSFPSEGRGGGRALNSRWAKAKELLRLFSAEQEGRRLGVRGKRRLKRVFASAPAKTGRRDSP